MTVTKLLDMDDLFRNLSNTPIIANTVAMGTEAERAVFDNALLTVYDGDGIKSAPACVCGNLTGRLYLGETCSKCGDEVTEEFEDKIESKIWLVPLKGTEAFITPVSFVMLQNLMKVGGVDCLKYLTDPYHKPNRTTPPRLRHVMSKGHKRGIAYYYQNFDEVMRDFIEAGSNKINDDMLKLSKFIEYNRDRIFTKALPVPNRRIFPIENAGASSYGDTNMVGIIDAVRIIQESESRGENISLAKRENRMVKVMELFADFHYTYVKKNIGTKAGSFRQHVFGGRWHFTSRAVVVSIYNPHDFREVHFPWVVAMSQFQIQIVNKLITRGFDLYEIHELLRVHALKYSPLLDKIFQELIDESPFIGLPILLQRNPTIRRPSAILVYVTKVKQNTADFTIGMSVGNLTGMNADFDGDQLNTISLQDIVSHDNFVVLSPDYNVMDTSNPWQVSRNLAMQSPVISTTANWLSNGRKLAYGE